VYPNGGDCGSAQLGEVKPPAAITQLNLLANNQNNSNSASGLMLFISRLINFFVIICGLWTLFNFLYAGFVLITGQSDAKAMATVKESLTMTAIGLAIIASAYLIAGVIGLIFFGDASFILNPKITGAIDLK
jgi:magnesium-transporting ATPase (P-type)